MTIVTLSASFGAGGGQVGPRLSERLKVDFLDRAIPVAVAERLDVPLADAESHEQPIAGVLDRLLASFAPVGGMYGTPLALDQTFGDRAYATTTEEVIRERCADSGAVILGRAAALVLKDDPRALHVRLDGSKEDRLARAMEREGVDRETAARLMDQTDRAREAYVQHFYGADARDQSLYDLIIDSTRIDLDACVEMILLAARSVDGAQAA